MRNSSYTSLAFQLNGALDNGDCSGITVEKIKYEIEKGTIFSFLHEIIPLFDDSLLEQKDKKQFIEQWQDLMHADIDYKLCVEKNGICLLVAYLLEGIQRNS